MARPSTISREEVFAAVAAIIAAGAYPNPSNVRQHLDGRGSPPLVQRHIGAWYKEFGPELARKAAAAPAKPATHGLQEELKRLTQGAMNDIEAAQAARIEALEDRAAGLDQREADLLALELRLQEREHVQTELIDQLRADAADQCRLRNEAEQIASGAREQLVGVQGQVKALKQRIGELDSAGADADGLKRELALARSEVSREQARVVELVGERDRLQRSVSERIAENAKRSGQLERADQTIDGLRVALADTRQQLDVAAAELVAQKTRAGHMKRALDAAEQRAIKAEAQTEAASTSARTLQLQRSELAAQLKGLQEQQGQVQPVQDALEVLTRDVQALGALLRNGDKAPRGKPGGKNALSASAVAKSETANGTLKKE